VHAPVHGLARHVPALQRRLNLNLRKEWVLFRNPHPPRRICRSGAASALLASAAESRLTSDAAYGCRDAQMTGDQQSSQVARRLLGCAARRSQKSC
jgi:hypothetical protein